MIKTTTLNLFLIILFNSYLAFGQAVPILNYSINSDGQVQLEVASSTNKYYILKVRHDSTSTFELVASMTKGKSGTTIITEQLGHYPLNHYQVLEYSTQSSQDTDGDGSSDITEYQNIPTKNPLNPASSIHPTDGLIIVNSMSDFNLLSTSNELVQWSEFLNGKRYAKFIIVDFYTSPKVYFINSNSHSLHNDFASHIGINSVGNDVKKGQIIYHPATISNNGSLGTFAFNYSNGHGQDFDVVQKCNELLAANMPFLNNNLSYFVTDNSEDEYSTDSLLYEDSRVSILFEDDIYAEVDYWGLNQMEGFGFFREMAAGDLPDFKDIILSNSLPNSLPRVGGIITSVIQTPLSHVNLRAIQDAIPNAFIRNPLDIDSIANLLNHYIYFKVEQSGYIIREATLAEVNSWFEHLRPEEEQAAPLNLNYTSILPLDEISFEMSDGFGAKCANIATMNTFGFPEGTIPDGFGIPFYFYQAFMRYNNFFEEATEMMVDPDFIADRAIRDVMLKDFRNKIKGATMPDWMLDELTQLQASFPAASSIRCRSSTNNEDLPGFNGAGLYDSKTQHPHEGHISKSIKQIYASLWNLRAFDERDFYRVNHFKASMGILCHLNFSGEKANGVGVSADPMYQTENTFYYINTQIGEDLITNPNVSSNPEEILLDKEVSTSQTDYILVRKSNLVPDSILIMHKVYLDQMREYLTVIHDKFEVLYEASHNNTFAMEIEYKIDANNQLVIKQARPWVSYVPTKKIKTDNTNVDFKIYPNPAQEYITLESSSYNLSSLKITSIVGQEFVQKNLSLDDSQVQLYIKDLPVGVYVITAFSEKNKACFSKKFVKN